MTTQTLIWINTLALIAGSMAQIVGLIYLGAILHLMRREGATSELRLAGMLEAIATVLRPEPRR